MLVKELAGDEEEGGVVHEALDRAADKFWQEWYPAHRRDVIVSIPLRTIRVNDFRKVLEIIFGKPADHVVDHD